MKEFLLSPTGLGYTALGLILLGTALKAFIPKKVDTISKVEGIVFKVFNFVEKAIPDDLIGDSKLNKALSKADLFAKKFVEEYNKKYGKPPTSAEISVATDVAEKLVYKKNTGA